MKSTSLRALALAVLVAIPLLSACTPEQIALWESFTPEQQQGVLADAARKEAASRASHDCYSAIDRHWGGNATAKRIMWRESRNQPSARSPSGTYHGCMQMGLPLHAHRFRAVGCDPWSQWMNPDCNIRAAMHLQREGGWGHWTTY